MERKLLELSVRRLTSAPLLFALLVVGSAHTAGAAGVVGTGTAANCTETALNGALAGGGLVTFNCGGAATISVATTKVVSIDTTIDGGNLVTISGGNTVRVFSVNAGINLTVQNLTIANGTSMASEAGGGIYNSGTLTIGNSTFSGNTSNGIGGGLFSDGALLVSHSTFSGNSAEAGGAIANTGMLMVTGSTFSGNRGQNAGAIWSYGTGGTRTLDDSTFSGNGASSAGGGLENSGMLAITRTTFSGNTATVGGGVANDGTLTITDSTFSANTATVANGVGGAIYSYGALTVTGSTLSGNSASDGGGGLYNIYDGKPDHTLTVSDSTFASNIGGGIFNDMSTVAITNSTFSGNAAGSNYVGGAIFNTGGGTLMVTNSTLAGNSASDGIGGIHNYSGSQAMVVNSILDHGSSGGNCVGTIIDGAHNIADDGSCGFSAASLSNTNPMLDPAGLASNGGATQTIALQAGSPAINAGDQGVCAALPVDNLDQRGYVRPGAGAASCSIGAYEYNATAPPPSSPTATRTITPTGSPTDTPPSTATPTATATQVPPTVTRTKTATATAAPPCVGDCDGSGGVTVNELITLVNVALGNAQSSACPHGVPSGDKVDISLIVHSVDNALSCGCNVVCPTPPPTRPPTQTGTPTRTPTFAPTPTPTPRPPTATPTLPAVGKVLFEEGWEKSAAQQYGPLSVIRGDTGAWLNGIGDVSDACRATTASAAQVIVQGGSHRLQLHSARDPDCSDDSEFVEPIVLTNPVGPRDLNIAVDENVYLSFEETGALVDPDPCDAVTVSVAFDHGDPLTYVLQHGSAWDTDPGSCGGIFADNVILLPADQGSFVRNLSDDAASVDVFPADNVNAIEFGVRSHGDATFDNITFFSAAGAPPAPTATPTPKPSGGGGGCLRVSGGNSTVKVVNSSHSLIQVYLGDAVAFGADIPAGKCFLFGIDLPDDYTLNTDVEISQCMPIDVGECGDLFGPMEDVPISLEVGQTATITVGSNFFK